MAATIYLLCTGTAALCAMLLLRGYRSNHVRLLLWSGICFSLLALDNLFLFLDRIIFTHIDMSPWRSLFALLGVLCLLYGLVGRGQK